MHIKIALLIQSLTAGAWALTRSSPLCLIEPAMLLEAGNSSISITVNSPMETRCEATIQFADPSFLPVRFSFESAPCDGLQINYFTIPNEAPSGDADVIWQCSGMAPTCSHAVISGGGANLSIPLENQGSVGCLVETLHTRTTLVTLIRSSGTFIETAPTIFTTTSTSFITATDSKFTNHSTRTALAPSAELSVETIDNPTPTSTDEPTSARTRTRTRTSTGDDKAESAAETSTPPAADPHTPGLSGISSPTHGASKPRTRATQSGSNPTNDSVFLSTATRTTNISLIPAVTMSIISTLTVIHTVAAECTTS